MLHFYLFTSILAAGACLSNISLSPHR